MSLMNYFMLLRLILYLFYSPDEKREIQITQKECKICLDCWACLQTMTS